MRLVGWVSCLMLVACGGSAASVASSGDDSTVDPPASDAGIVFVDGGGSRPLGLARAPLGHDDNEIDDAGIDATDVGIDSGAPIVDSGVDAADSASVVDAGTAPPVCTTNAARCDGYVHETCDGTEWNADFKQDCCTDPGSRWSVTGELATDSTTGIVWDRDIISTDSTIDACPGYFPGDRIASLAELRSLVIGTGTCQPAFDQQVFMGSTGAAYTSDGVCFSFNSASIVPCANRLDSQLCVHP